MPTTRALLSGALTTAALLAPATASAAAEPGLLARWSLDRVDAGTTPNTVDARLTGTNVTGALTPTGRFGGALSLGKPGPTQGFDAADADRLLESPSVTVSAWVRGATAPDGHVYLVSKSGNSQADPGKGGSACELSAFSLFSAGGAGPQFATTYLDEDGDPRLTITPEVPAAQVWDGAWHAIAGIYDASAKTLSLAVDGKVVATEPSLGEIPYGYFNYPGLAIGRFPHPGCERTFEGLGGDVDDVRVYGRALTVPELAFLADPAAKEAPELPIVKPQPDPPVDRAPSAPNPTGPVLIPAPTPNPLKPVPVGSTAAGAGKVTKPGPAVGEAMEKVKQKVKDALAQAPKSSAVTKSVDKLSKKDAAKVKPSKDLQSTLKKLKYGLPVKISAPGSAKFVETAACVAVQRKVGGKVETTTVVLPPVVLPVVGGQAKGKVMVDKAAAKALAKPGAATAGVCTTSVVIEQMANLTPAQLAALQGKLDKQSTLTKQLDQQVAEVAKQQKLLDQKLGASKKPTASELAKQKEKLRDAEESAAEQQAELAKQVQQNLDEMIKNIIEFLKQMTDAQSQQMQSLTRV